MGVLAPFLPPHLLRSLERLGPPPRLPHAERFSAALLLSDISGFTALTERLQARGREGAEEIADAVNSAFASSIRAIGELGGSIVSFGGDALFAVFRGSSPARRALAVAEAIRRDFAARPGIATSAGFVRLGISQAVHHGEVLGLHLGTASRRQYVVMGPAVAELARLESRAADGQIHVSAAARRATRQERPVRRPDETRPRVPAAVLRSYLEPRLAPLLSSFEGGFRRVAVLFLESAAGDAGSVQSFYLELCDALVRTDGVLLKTDMSSSGTKWICVFGIPVAHEEDPSRAARAGLDTLARAPAGFKVRGGLHAGAVANIVVGTGSRKSFDLIGDVVNTAARVLAEAAWGELLFTAETGELIVGVDSEPRGSRKVKGKASPLELHALKAASGATRRIRVSAPMIGRDAELARIVDALGRARSGRGTAIAIAGAAGLGKSRLGYEAANAARGMGFLVHEGRASSFGGMAYGTIGGLLKDVLGLPEVPLQGEVLARVSEAADRLGLSPVDRHHLADVLGSRYPESPIGQLQPKDVRLNAVMAVRAFFRAIAGVAPRLLVLEDMHGADAGSVEAAKWLAEGTREAPFVVLLIHRQGYEPPGDAERIALGDLAPDAVVALLEANLGRVPEKVGGLVRERAGGNPLYVEEIVRHLLEAGILRSSDAGYELVREPRADDIPGSIESLIAARLDRLSPAAKRVAQHGAVVGGTFLLGIVARMIGAQEDTSAVAAELVERELVWRKAREPEEYVWKPAIARDVTYSSILAGRRRELHRRAAAAIEALFTDDHGPFLATVGYHRERGAQPARARSAYLAAARFAVARFAHEDAQRAYGAFLALAPRRSHARANALVELGTDLSSCGRNEEAVRHLEEAVALASRLGARALRARALHRQADVYRLLGRQDRSVACGRAALELYRALGNRSGEGRALLALGYSRRESGVLDEAYDLVAAAGDILRASRQDLLLARALSAQAIIRADQGRLAESTPLYERTIAITRRLGRRQPEGSALANLAMNYHARGSLARARELLGQALRIHRSIGDRLYEGMSLGNLASIHRDMGNVAAARECAEEALAIQRATADRWGEAVTTGDLGAIIAELGDPQRGRELLDEALVLARTIGSRYHEARTQLDRAWLERRTGGSLARAERMVSRAQRICETMHNSLDLSRCYCERGHIALARGRPADEWLSRGRDALEPSLRRSHDRWRRSPIARLRRAILHAGKGIALEHGEAPEPRPGSP